VLGASGGCGRWVTRLAAESGHDVTAMVRPGADYDPPEGVRVVRASALEPERVAQASRGRDAVLCCIGAQRVHPFNPWSSLRPPHHVCELAAKAIVAGLLESGVRRVVAISAAGVGDSFDRINPLMRWFVRRSTIGHMYADLEAMEALFRRSHLDWMTVRPVTLIKGKPTHKAREVDRFRTSAHITRGDVAAWMLGAVMESAPLGGRTPMIAGPG
jgi:uncharacterized protein YbjT (DUF2867 family)